MKIKWIVEMFESRIAATSDIDRQRILDLLHRQQIWKLLKDTITGSVKLLERYPLFNSSVTNASNGLRQIPKENSQQCDDNLSIWKSEENPWAELGEEAKVTFQMLQLITLKLLRLFFKWHFLREQPTQLSFSGVKDLKRATTHWNCIFIQIEAGAVRDLPRGT